MELEDEIKGITYHSLNFVISRLMEECFSLAFEGELSDLKGLVEPDSFCETMDHISVLNTELDLLDSLEDPVVKGLMVSVNRVLECSRTFLMINNLVGLEIIQETDCFDSASGLYYSYDVEEPEEGMSYRDRLYALYSHYLIFQMVICHCSCMFTFKKREAYPETDALYFDRTDDLFEGKIEVEDKNAQLLVTLVAGLQEDILVLGEIIG